MVPNRNRGVKIADFTDFDEIRRTTLETYAKELLAGKELIVPFSGCQDVMQYAFSIEKEVNRRSPEKWRVYVRGVTLDDCNPMHFTALSKKFMFIIAPVHK